MSCHRLQPTRRAWICKWHTCTRAKDSNCCQYLSYTTNHGSLDPTPDDELYLDET